MAKVYELKSKTTYDDSNQLIYKTNYIVTLSAYAKTNNTPVKRNVKFHNIFARLQQAQIPYYTLIEILMSLKDTVVIYYAKMIYPDSMHMLGPRGLTVVRFVGSTLEIHVGSTQVCSWDQRGSNMLVPR